MKNTIRTINAIILTPGMKLTGFRFNKSYRRGDTKIHQIVFACVDTVGANMSAERENKLCTLSLSLLASIVIVASITIALSNATQYRVNFNQSGITLSK
jgi:hypothetical protein